jgi:DNA (cytosine-5)-methyltransferase 1
MGIKVVDLFCGCGGMSIGLRDAGLPVLAGFDNWQPAIDTYNLNLNSSHDHPAIKVDLNDVDASVAAILEVLGHVYPDDIVVIAGGPPCQDYSTANKWTYVGQTEEGAKADLTWAYAQIIGRINPHIFIMENVPRVVKSLNYSKMCDHLATMGYLEFKGVLQVEKYGVPQSRSRYIVIGYRDNLLEGINEEMGVKSLASPVMPSTYLPHLERYYRHPTTYMRRAIFRTDELAPTVRGLNRPMPKTYVKHKNDACESLEGVRSLTADERARLQTFPENFMFPKGMSKGHCDQMVGNAVPCKFAEAIGSAVLGVLRNNGRISSDNLDVVEAEPITA